MHALVAFWQRALLHQSGHGRRKKSPLVFFKLGRGVRHHFADIVARIVPVRSRRVVGQLLAEPDRVAYLSTGVRTLIPGTRKKSECVGDIIGTDFSVSLCRIRITRWYYYILRLEYLGIALYCTSTMQICKYTKYHANVLYRTECRAAFD